MDILKNNEKRASGKKNIIKTIRFTEEEFSSFKVKAENAGLNPSEYLRRVALNSSVIYSIKNQKERLARKAKAYNNINQIARNLNIANKEGSLSDIDFALLAKDLDDLIQVISED